MIAHYDEVICQKASLQRLFQERKGLEDRFDPQIAELKGVNKDHEMKMAKIRNSYVELEKSVTVKTMQVIKKFLKEREKINEAFDKDPHQSSELANRIQQSKLQLDLQNKADKYELENLNMTKCNRTDMNVLAEKIGTIQAENSQFFIREMCFSSKNKKNS